MHGRHQDQGVCLKIVQTRMQTDMGTCTYTGLMLSREISQANQEVTEPPKVTLPVAHLVVGSDSEFQSVAKHQRFSLMILCI